MKQKNLLIACIAVFLLSSGFGAISARADRLPITTTVRFGDPASGSCTGKGICNNSDASAISVTFTYIDHNTMVMSFSLADLQSHQSDQVSYFMASSYIFDTHYTLNSSIFGSWNLNSGAWISTASSSSISIVNGIVYDTIGIDYYY